MKFRMIETLDGNESENFEFEGPNALWAIANNLPEDATDIQLEDDCGNSFLQYTFILDGVEGTLSAEQVQS